MALLSPVTDMPLNSVKDGYDPILSLSTVSTSVSALSHLQTTVRLLSLVRTFTRRVKEHCARRQTCLSSTLSSTLLTTPSTSSPLHSRAWTRASKTTRTDSVDRTLDKLARRLQITPRRSRKEQSNINRSTPVNRTFPSDFSSDISTKQLTSHSGVASSQDLQRKLKRLVSSPLHIEYHLDDLAFHQHQFVTRKAEFTLDCGPLHEIYRHVSEVEDLLSTTQHLASAQPNRSIDISDSTTPDEFHRFDLLHKRYLDETYLANLEHLLLSLLQQLVAWLVFCFQVALHAVWTWQRQQNQSQLTWFFEFPDAQPPLSTTWPWSIKPSLAVLWGVCWMFYTPISQDLTLMPDGAYDANGNLAIPRNVLDQLNQQRQQALRQEQQSRSQQMQQQQLQQFYPQSPDIPQMQSYGAAFVAPSHTAPSPTSAHTPTKFAQYQWPNSDALAMVRSTNNAAPGTQFSPDQSPIQYTTHPSASGPAPVYANNSNMMSMQSHRGMPGTSQGPSLTIPHYKPGGHISSSSPSSATTRSPTPSSSSLLQVPVSRRPYESQLSQLQSSTHVTSPTHSAEPRGSRGLPPRAVTSRGMARAAANTASHQAAVDAKFWLPQDSHHTSTLAALGPHASNPLGTEVLMPSSPVASLAVEQQHHQQHQHPPQPGLDYSGVGIGAGAQASPPSAAARVSNTPAIRVTSEPHHQQHQYSLSPHQQQSTSAFSHASDAFFDNSAAAAVAAAAVAAEAASSTSSPSVHPIDDQPQTRYPQPYSLTAPPPYPDNTDMLPVSPVSAQHSPRGATGPDIPTRKRSHSEMSQPPDGSGLGMQTSNTHSRDASIASMAASPGDDFSPRASRAFKRGDPPMNADNKFICDFASECEGLVFDRKCEWSKHMDKHDRPYRCPHPQCAKLQGFTYSGGLLRHEREVHNKHGGPKAQLMCPWDSCKRHTGKGFTRRENLNEHVRRVHSAKEPAPQILFATDLTHDLSAAPSSDDPLAHVDADVEHHLNGLAASSSNPSSAAVLAGLTSHSAPPNKRQRTAASTSHMDGVFANPAIAAATATPGIVVAASDPPDMDDPDPSSLARLRAEVKRLRDEANLKDRRIGALEHALAEKSGLLDTFIRRFQQGAV